MREDFAGVRQGRQNHGEWKMSDGELDGGHGNGCFGGQSGVVGEIAEERRPGEGRMEG